MKAYTVKYQMLGGWEDVKSISFLAVNKYDAYDRATYELIPEKEGALPYSSWVSSVTYQNGNVRYFNTSAGNAY